MNIAPLADHQGKVTGAINCFYDVTERKNFERERETLLANERASRMEAEEVNRSKDIFLATLSHEVRTPLNAMLGWATILRKKQCTEQEVREGAEVIERNCRAQSGSCWKCALAWTGPRTTSGRSARPVGAWG